MVRLFLYFLICYDFWIYLNIEFIINVLKWFVVIFGFKGGIFCVIFDEIVFFGKK